MPGRSLRAPADLAPASGRRRGRSSSSSAAASSARASLRPGSMRSPTRAFPSSSCREAARWPTRCAPASRGSASAMRPRTAWRCSPWISSPGPWPGCGRASPWARPKPNCAMRSSAAPSRSGRLMPRSPGAPTSRRSWRLTSDSLALWLAARLGAARCYLIKSIARPKAPRLSARQLARDGVVDEAFADMLAETGTPTILLGRGDQDGLRRLSRRGPILAGPRSIEPTSRSSLPGLTGQSSNRCGC